MMMPLAPRAMFHKCTRGIAYHEEVSLFRQGGKNFMINGEKRQQLISVITVYSVHVYVARLRVTLTHRIFIHPGTLPHMRSGLNVHDHGLEK